MSKRELSIEEEKVAVTRKWERENGGQKKFRRNTNLKRKKKKRK